MSPVLALKWRESNAAKQASVFAEIFSSKFSVLRSFSSQHYPNSLPILFSKRRPKSAWRNATTGLSLARWISNVCVFRDTLTVTKPSPWLRLFLMSAFMGFTKSRKKSQDRIPNSKNLSILKVFFEESMNLPSVIYSIMIGRTFQNCNIPFTLQIQLLRSKACKRAECTVQKQLGSCIRNQGYC